MTGFMLFVVGYLCVSWYARFHYLSNSEINSLGVLVGLTLISTWFFVSKFIEYLKQGD